MNPEIKVGLLGASGDLTFEIRAMLAGTADVESIPQADWDLPLPVDVLFVAPSGAVEPMLPVVAQLRAVNPRIPILMVASGVSGQVAVEFIHRGADDFLSLPLNKAALRIKLERAMRERAGRTLRFASASSAAPTLSSSAPSDAPSAEKRSTLKGLSSAPPPAVQSKAPEPARTMESDPGARKGKGKGKKEKLPADMPVALLSPQRVAQSMRASGGADVGPIPAAPKTPTNLEGKGPVLPTLPAPEELQV